MRKIGFTLIELVTIIVIIGILVGLASVSYVGRRQAAIDNEAKAMLLLICAAERDYKETTGTYVNCDNTQDCNTKLGLSIPYGGSQRWRYLVHSAWPIPFNPALENFVAQAIDIRLDLARFQTTKDCIIDVVIPEGR